MTITIRKAVPRLIERDMGGRGWSPRIGIHKKPVLFAFVKDREDRLGHGILLAPDSLDA